MMIAVKTNVKTAHQCWTSQGGLGLGFGVAIQGGSVMGLSLVSLGVIALFILIELYDLMLKPGEFDATLQGFAKKWQLPFENADAKSIAGYGLGGSSIDLFGRVGGGIYTKAADMGDIAGMDADLFRSFAEATCAALVLVASSNDLQSSWKALMYLVLISSLGIVVGIVTLILRNVIYRVHDEFGAVEKAFQGYSHHQHCAYEPCGRAVVLGGSS